MRPILPIVLSIPLLAAASEPPPAKDRAPIELRSEDVRAFVSVLRAVKEGYVDPVDDQTLFRGAIAGVLAELDPHSALLSKDELEQWDEGVQGVYGGLGVEVIEVDGALKVIAPIDDSPAARAGIRAGDAIVAIDGTAVAEREDQALAQLRGPAGTQVKLTIEREGQDGLLEFTLTREEILAQSVRMRWLEPGYAYARISVFQENTGTEFRDRLRKLKADGGVPRGLVLDLRDNPGGVLQAAVEVADALLDGGVVVKTKGRLASADETYRAEPGDLLDGAPVVVLIDGGSASASEIVAGALKDHRRALLIGKRSFGKGSVQNVLPLETGGAIKLTTARYYTPSGHSIQAQGITPDIELSDLQLVPEDHGPRIIESEATLRRHLEADTPARDGDASVSRDSELDRDYALNAAFHALKALVVAQRQGARTPG